MKKSCRKRNPESKLIWVILALLAIICIIPILMVFATSISDEDTVRKIGYTIWPVKPTISAYELLFRTQGSTILRGFKWTILATILGTIFNMFIVTTYAYAVTQPKSEFRLTRFFSLLIWVTSIINGGTLPWYILCTQVYGFKNNLWALFVPTGVATFYVFILRGNFRQVPIELKEAALLDGASNAQIFGRIYLPLAKNGLATIAMFYVVGMWNDYYHSLYLISDAKMYTLQRVLQNMLEFFANIMKESLSTEALSELAIPMYTTKMALVMITVVPIVLLYPFALKYIVKGVTLGGVKG